jgi:hypothetical protein
MAEGNYLHKFFLNLKLFQRKFYLKNKHILLCNITFINIYVKHFCICIYQLLYCKYQKQALYTFRHSSLHMCLFPELGEGGKEKRMILHQHNHKTWYLSGWRHRWVVKCLPSIYEALGLIPNTAKTSKQTKKQNISEGRGCKDMYWKWGMGGKGKGE